MLPPLYALTGPIKNGYRVPSGPNPMSIRLPFELARPSDAVVNVLVNAFRGVGQIANVVG